jgi:hypothetical protein
MKHVESDFRNEGQYAMKKPKRYSDEWRRALIVYSFTDHRLKHPAFIGIPKRAQPIAPTLGALREKLREGRHRCLV